MSKYNRQNFDFDIVFDNKSWSMNVYFKRKGMHSHLPTNGRKLHSYLNIELLQIKV